MAAIKRIPLVSDMRQSYVRNSAPATSNTKKWVSEPHPNALLVPPREAFRLIDNVDIMRSSLSTEPNKELLRRFIVDVYGLNVVRDIIQNILNKANEDQGEISVYEIFDFDIDKEEVISKINAELRKSYKEHLGRFFDIVPGNLNGGGSNIMLLEASVPNFKVDKRSPTGFSMSADEGLGVPPSINALMSRLAAHTPSSEYFGYGQEGGIGSSYLDGAQSSMIEYVRAYASGKLSEHVTEASSKSEYLNKIAKRRKQLERTMLTMGEPDIHVDDIIG